MPPEAATYLRDMLDAVQAIEDQVRGLAAAEFLARRGVRDAVTWNLCVIGEALNKLVKVDEPTARQITDSRKIVAVRNQLIHGYAVINHDITWEIATEKLPILRRELEQMLAS